MVVATKMEEGETLAVSEEEGRNFALANDCLFATTSAKQGHGVIRAFQELCGSVLSHQETKDEQRETLWLTAARNSSAAPKRGCC